MDKILTGVINPQVTVTGELDTLDLALLHTYQAPFTFDDGDILDAAGKLLCRLTNPASVLFGSGEPLESLVLSDKHSDKIQEIRKVIGSHVACALNVYWQLTNYALGDTERLEKLDASIPASPTLVPIGNS